MISLKSDLEILWKIQQRHLDCVNFQTYYNEEFELEIITRAENLNYPITYTDKLRVWSWQDKQ